MLGCLVLSGIPATINRLRAEESGGCNKVRKLSCYPNLGGSVPESSAPSISLKLPSSDWAARFTYERKLFITGSLSMTWLRKARCSWTHSKKCRTAPLRSSALMVSHRRFERTQNGENCALSTQRARLLQRFTSK